MQEEDSTFKRKYAKLKPEYLENVAHYANLDDVISGEVSINDAELIINYSGNLSSMVHYRLKSGSMKKGTLIEKYEVGLHSALNKLPSYNSQIVYRMEIHSPSIPDYINYFSKYIGKVMEVPFYLSTSKEEWEDEIVFYVISTSTENSNAKDISRVTNNAVEKEVLFMKHSCFLIDKIERKNSKLYIHMKETSDFADFIYNYIEIRPDDELTKEEEELGLFD